MTKLNKELAKYVAGQALVLSLFFGLLELMKGFRASQWSGLLLTDTPQVLLGFLAYFLLCALGVSAISAILLTLMGRWMRQQTAVLMAGAIAGAAVWGWLSLYREFSPNLDDAVVLGGLVGIAVGGVIVGRWRGSFFWLASGALAAGITALLATGEVYLFDLNRARAVTLLPLAWAGIMGTVGLVAWWYRDYRVRIAWGIVAVGAPLVACHALTAPSQATADARPNLIFIVADSLRADYMSAYGGTVPMPHLDALARGGTLFEHSYSLAPWTMPSMAAMFSSDHPASLTPGTDKEAWLSQLWQYGVNPNTRGLAERLRDAGYTTGAFTANTLLWSMPGMMDGFDMIGGAHPLLLVKQGVFQHFPFLQDALSAVRPELANLRPSNTSDRIQRYAKAYLRRVADKPFYMWMHYMDPHVPYDCPSQYRTMDGAWPFFYPYEGGEQWNLPIIGNDFVIPESEHDYIRSLYQGEIRYIDELVGELLAELKSRGLSENTYVCFTADHGEEFWEHGGWEHAHTVYDELIRVPLVFSGPGIRAQRITPRVSAVDLMPTLAELMGVEADAGWKGESLGPVLRDGSAPNAKPIFAQATSNKSWPNPLQTVIWDGYKLIRGAADDTMALFNLDQDPGEKIDLAAEEAERAAALRSMLLEWMDGFQWTFDAEVCDPDAERERLEAMKSMGYL